LRELLQYRARTEFQSAQESQSQARYDIAQDASWRLVRRQSPADAAALASILAASNDDFLLPPGATNYGRSTRHLKLSGQRQDSFDGPCLSTPILPNGALVLGLPPACIDLLSEV
jgi:phage-related baseplate assembly protein